MASILILTKKLSKIPRHSEVIDQNTIGYNTNAVFWVVTVEYCIILNKFGILSAITSHPHSSPY